MIRTALRGTALIVALALAGCAALEREAERRTPEASVTGARVAGFDFDAARLLFDVEVDNPNPVGIDVAGLDYDLRLGGERALSGESDERGEIPRRGSGSVAVPVTLDYRELRDQFSGLRWGSESDYEIDFGVHVDVPLLGERRLPASTSGTLPIPERPRVSVQDLRVERLGLDGARMALDVEVANANAFGLDLSALSYSLQIDGSDWASGTLERAARVDAEGSTTLSVPIDLDFGEMASGVRRMLLEGRRADFAFSGSLRGSADVDGLGDFELGFDEEGATGLGR